MIQQPQDTFSPGHMAALFDPEEVAKMLRGLIAWPGRAAPHDVRVERYWPMRDKAHAYVFEWSFKLGTAERWSLSGRTCSAADSSAENSGGEARLTPDGIRGVHAHSTEAGVIVHSADRDSRCPHLATCLDQTTMADQLAATWARIDPRFAFQGQPRCHLLGYRPGRRAAIRYLPAAAEGDQRGVVGKLYRDDRAKRLQVLHWQLNEQLRWHSRGRIRVPVVLDHLPDLRMALFTWGRGANLGDLDGWQIETATRAVDGLAALHLSWLDGLPAYTIQDECAIVQRWQSAMARLHPALTQFSKPVANGLLHRSGSLESSTACLIHRDFYERQIILGRKTTTLLDLDTLALGHPCVDLGNMLAHLFLNALDKGHGVARFDALASVLLNHYESQSSRVDRRALGFYFASSLFRIGAVHAMRTRTGRFSRPMWALAAQVLADLDEASDRPRLGFLGGGLFRSYRVPDQARTAVALESLS